MRRDRLSLRGLPLKSARARPLRTMILALLALAQTACALTGLLLVQSTRAELSLARDRLGADVVVYPSAGFLQLDKSCVQMVGSPVLFHKERSTLSRLNSNEDIDRIAYQLYLNATEMGIGTKGGSPSGSSVSTRPPTSSSRPGSARAPITWCRRDPSQWAPMWRCRGRAR